jgi:hypothetical protein
MDNFDLKKYLSEGKLDEASDIDLEGNKIGRQTYDVLDEYLPQLTTNQRFKLYQMMLKFVREDKNQY